MKKILFLLVFCGCFFCGWGQQVPGEYTELWGTTTSGGYSNNGVIYKINETGHGYEVKHQFSVPGKPGINPASGLFEASDGWYYGITSKNGVSEIGTIYRTNSSMDTIETVFHFIDSLGRPYPHSIYFGRNNMLYESNGMLYGTLHLGGSNQSGVLYSIDLQNSFAFSVLHHFVDSSGSLPCGGLLVNNGEILGMTETGGTDSKGVIYKYEINTSTYVKLIDFNGTNGAHPQGSLLLDGNKIMG